MARSHDNVAGLVGEGMDDEAAAVAADGGAAGFAAAVGERIGEESAGGEWMLV